MDAKAKNTTAQTWRERIVVQQSSGRSIRAWCRENRCQEHSFYWWRARLNLSPVGTQRRGRLRVGKPVHFAQLVVEAPGATSSQSIRMSLVGGRELALPVSMPVDQSARLVRAIERTP